MQDHEAAVRVCARAPQDDDAEKMDALGSYLEKYPPPGFAERYSADGWRHIARGVLSAALIFFAAPSPSRDGSVAVEDVVAALRAKDAMHNGSPKCLDVAADWLEGKLGEDWREFSPASTGGRPLSE